MYSINLFILNVYLQDMGVRSKNKSSLYKVFALQTPPGICVWVFHILGFPVFFFFFKVFYFIFAGTVFLVFCSVMIGCKKVRKQCPCIFREVLRTACRGLPLFTGIRITFLPNSCIWRLAFFLCFAFIHLWQWCQKMNLNPWLILSRIL